MIEPVLSYLNTQIATLNIYKELNGLAHMIDEPTTTGEVRSFPAIYKGKDNLKFITNYDFRSGALWHQRNGEVQVTELERIIATSANIEQVIPMRLYAIHKKVYHDTEYSPEEVLANLIHKVNQRNINSLRSSLKLNRIQVEVTGYTSGTTILEDIFSGVDIKFRHELDIVSINYNIRLQGNQSCFTNYSC